jgi:hypothetical protein
MLHGGSIGMLISGSLRKSRAGLAFIGEAARVCGTK